MAKTKQWVHASTLLACAVMLAACGGGDEDGGSKGVGPSFTVDPASVSPQKTVAQQAYALELDANGAYLPSPNEFFAFNAQQCGQGGQIGAAVWETPNVVVYNQGAASDEQARKIAQYGEASVLSLRDRYGIMPSNGIGFDGQKVRICTTVEGKNYSGSAGIRTQFIAAPDGGSQTGTMVFHEMVHMVQAQALNCQTRQYRWERWLTEGMALAVAGQDGITKKQLGAMKKAFADAPGGLPFADMDQGMAPRNDRYPGYRLAVETFLDATHKTDLDLYAFMKHVGDTQGCPGEDVFSQPNWNEVMAQGWKAEFDSFFGVDLRGQGIAGSGFWDAAERYLD